MSLFSECEPGALKKWNEFENIFINKSINLILDDLENRFNISDETRHFADLVNMSTALKNSYHRWIRYREGYAGELVKEIFRKFPIDGKKAFVVDPMCGSGSTLVACKEEGIDSLGIDVNGYAVLASNVKVLYYSDKTKKEIRLLVKSLYQKPYIGLSSPIKHTESISKYFGSSNLKILENILIWTDNILDKDVREFFLLALLACLEDCSNRKKDGNGLATRLSPINSVYDRYICQVKMMLEDIENNPLCKTVHSKAVDGSALELSSIANWYGKKWKKHPGCIIFSPPYANSFDYFESYKMELIFGRFVVANEFDKARKRLIRNYRIGYGQELVSDCQLIEQLCSEIWNRIPIKEIETGVRDGRTRLVPNMLRAYFADMRKVIEEGFKTLRSNGMMHIVVDQSAYVGVPIPTDLIFGVLSEECGFNVVSIMKCRNANTSGQQLRRHPYLRKLLRESIVSIRKP